MSRAIIEELRCVREHLVEIDAQCAELQTLVQRLRAEGGDASANEARLQVVERQRADLCDNLLILEGRVTACT